MIVIKLSDDQVAEYGVTNQAELLEKLKGLNAKVDEPVATPEPVQEPEATVEETATEPVAEVAEPVTAVEPAVEEKVEEQINSQETNAVDAPIENEVEETAKTEFAVEETKPLAPSAIELAANVGTAPLPEAQVESSETASEDVIAMFNSIKNPKEKQKYWNEHRDEIMKIAFRK